MESGDGGSRAGFGPGLGVIAGGVPCADSDIYRAGRRSDVHGD